MTSKTKLNLMQKRFHLIERKLQIPMLLITLSYLLVFSIRLSVNLTPETDRLFGYFDFLIWLAFVVEYFVLLHLSPSKIGFIKTHILSLLIILIPSLRFLRAFDVFGMFLETATSVKSYPSLISRAVGSESRFISVFLYFSEAFNDIKKMIYKGRIFYVFVGIIFLVIFLGGMGVYFEKDNPNSNIKTISDGVWWGITSITTVGYGDRFPVTLGGRMIGVMFMTLGISLFSLLTAELSFSLIGKRENKDKREIMKKIDALEKKIVRRKK